VSRVCVSVKVCGYSIDHMRACVHACVSATDCECPRVRECLDSVYVLERAIDLWRKIQCVRLRMTYNRVRRKDHPSLATACRNIALKKFKTIA